MPNSPNMGLVLPTIGVSSGLSWEQAFLANMATIDSHDHSSSDGVQITQSGINLSGDLPLNSNNVTLLRSSRYVPQLTPLAGASDLNCSYVSGVDLWFNDGNGNQIQITSGGAVLATSSGISSGTASAAFSGGVLVVNAAAATPANIQGGSLLLGNNVASSKFLTLSPPSAMAANYGLSLPTIPASQSFLSIDTSGNIAAYTPVSGGIGPGNLAAVTKAVSSSTGGFNTNATSATPVTNASVTVTANGRPVIIYFQPDGSIGSPAAFGIGVASTNGSGTWLLLRDGITIGEGEIAGTTNMFLFSAPGFVFFDSAPTAGSHTYTVKVSVTNSTLTFFATNLVLGAYSL